MSDRNDGDAAEALAIEQALGRAMATGQEPRLLQGGAAADAGMVREYTELLGLLPYALAAEEPPVDLRGRILGRLSVADSTAHAAAGASVTPFPAPVRAPWVQVAMAAMLGVCLLGLGFTGALAWKKDQQIDRLQSELAAAVVAQGLTDGTLEAEVRTLRQRLDMITSVARQAYPMRRVSYSGARGQPEGIVYVCGNHQRWYLNLHGLEPPGPGEEYRLWFMTNGGKVDGGALDVRPDSSSEREAMSMPEGTHGFAVTLERRRQDQPESLTILMGEQAVSL